MATLVKTQTVDATSSTGSRSSLLVYNDTLDAGVDMEVITPTETGCYIGIVGICFIAPVDTVIEFKSAGVALKTLAIKANAGIMKNFGQGLFFACKPNELLSIESSAELPNFEISVMEFKNYSE